MVFCMTGNHGSLRALREGNQVQLLTLLREHGPMHRAELARRAGLSRTTVSTIVTDLLADGQIVERELDDRPERSRASPDGADRAPRDGRAGLLLTLNPSAGLALGVDFSYRQARVVLADLAHTVLAARGAELTPDQDWTANLDLAVSMAESALAEAGAARHRLIGAGLGVPGPIDQARHRVGFSSNATGWVGAHAADELAARLGTPVLLDNTCHLACLAESAWGAGHGCPDLIYLKLSYGVGSGLVIHGRIYRGAIGAAGELGHVTVHEEGPACRCGSRGCLEVYAGIPAVLAALRPLLGENVTVPEVLAAAAAGDRATRRVLADTGRVVGRAMASVCNLLNPGRVVIGGDLAAAGEVLLDPLRDALCRSALQIVGESLQVVPAALGDQAGALGGVALVLREGQRLAVAAEPSFVPAGKR